MNPFDRQFVVSIDNRPSPEGAVRHKLASVNVDVFPGLDAFDIRSTSGDLIGMVLGTLIDIGRQEIVKHPISVDIESGPRFDIGKFIEEHLYSYGGSFVTVLDMGGERRVYLDANGSSSLVYDPGTHVAAATTALILGPKAYTERFLRDLYVIFDVARDGWFTAGLTAHRGIRRLLCNHYLDLNTWSPVRHWPLARISEAGSVDAALAAIVDNVTRSLRALMKAGDVVLALTAGNETRLLLACCRNFIRDVTFVTVDAPGGELDLEIARRLARQFGLRHEILPYRRASDAEAESWRERVGHCVSGANVHLHPSVAPLVEKYFVGGLGGEIGRGFLWLDADNATNIDAKNIVTRLKLARHPLILSGVDQWLATVSHYESLFILDLAYMELRMSAWAFSQSYATPRPIELHPLISRANYTAMLSLPHSLRRGNGMIVRGIEMTWPELLSVPINRFGDWRDKLTLIRHAMVRPDRVVRKIRQLMKS